MIDSNISKKKCSITQCITFAAATIKQFKKIYSERLLHTNVVNSDKIKYKKCGLKYFSLPTYSLTIKKILWNIDVELPSARIFAQVKVQYLKIDFGKIMHKSIYR